MSVGKGQEVEEKSMKGNWGDVAMKVEAVENQDSTSGLQKGHEKQN